MKKSTLWSFVVGVAAFACYAWASPPIGRVGIVEVQNILALSQESQIINIKCVKFLARLRSKTLDSDKKEYFISRLSAQAALTAAPQYPGTPFATSNALDRYLNLLELPKGSQAGDLLTAINGLGDCHSIEFFGVLTRLLSSRTQQLLPEDEVAEIQKVVMSYLKRETNDGPRFLHQTLSLVKLTALALKEDVVHLPVSGLRAFKTLENKIAKLAFNNTTNEISFNLLSQQLNQSEELRDDLNLILELESSKHNRNGPKLETGPILLAR